MQILLASAKIMNDRSATKGDACQSKNVSVHSDLTLSIPAFRKEAESFARDMAQYSTETIAEILGCSHQIAAQNRLRFMRFFEDVGALPAILAYHGQAYKHLKAETLKAEDLQFAQQMACFAHWTAFSPIGWRDMLSCPAARIKICSDSGRAD